MQRRSFLSPQSEKEAPSPSLLVIIANRIFKKIVAILNGMKKRKAVTGYAMYSVTTCWSIQKGRFLKIEVLLAHR